MNSTRWLPLGVYLASLALPALADPPLPIKEDNTVRVIRGPFQNERHLPQPPELVQMSLDTVPVQFGETPVNLWSARFPAPTSTPSPTPTGATPTPTLTPTGPPAPTATPSPTFTPIIVVDTTIPFGSFHVSNRTPGIKSQHARLTWIWQWHRPSGELAQGKDWSDYQILRDDALH